MGSKGTPHRRFKSSFSVKYVSLSRIATKVMELSPLHTCQGVWVDVIGRKAHKREQGKGGGGINQAEFYPIPSSVSSSSKRSDDGRNLCCAAAVNLSVTRLPACSAPLSKSNENFFQIRKFRVVPKERGGEERNVR